MILKEISPECWKGADPKMRIIPESKIVVGVIVGERFKKIVIANANKKK
jgi:hypothetical protein